MKKSHHLINNGKENIETYKSFTKLVFLLLMLVWGFTNYKIKCKYTKILTIFIPLSGVDSITFLQLNICVSLFVMLCH